MDPGALLHDTMLYRGETSRERIQGTANFSIRDPIGAR